MGARTRRAALCLSFSAGPNQPFDLSLSPGTTIDADLVYFPSAFPLRALIKARHGSASAEIPALPHATMADALAWASDAFAANPWIERVPLGLASAIPKFEGRWILTDASGDLINLQASDELGWSLMALSGGHPIAVAGEWDGESVYPLGVWAEGRVHRCDR